MNTNQKYIEDISRCREISGHIKRKVKSNTQHRKDLIARFSDIFGIAESTARVHIVNYCGDIPVSGFSDGSKKTGYRKNGINVLERLAVFYKIIDIEPDDPLVRLTKKNKDFKYPVNLEVVRNKYNQSKNLHSKVKD